MSHLFHVERERRCEILGAVMLALTTLVFLALVTDEYQGSARRSLEGLGQVPNLLSQPGAVFAGTVAILVGDAAHVIYFLTLVWGLMLFRHKPLDRLPTRFVGMLILVGSVAGLLHLNFHGQGGLSNTLPGGALGAFMAGKLFVPSFGYIGSNVIGITMSVIGMLLATEFLFIHAAVVFQKAMVQFMRVNLMAVQWLAEAWRDGLGKARENWTQRQAGLVARAKNRAKERKDSNEADAPPPPARGPAIRIPGHENRPSAAVEPAVEPPPPITPPAPPEDLFEWVPEPPCDLPPEPPEQTAIDLEDPTEDPEPLVARPAAPVAADTLPRRRIKRKGKAAMMEELPADYVYPKVYTKPGIDMLDEGKVRIIKNLDEQLHHTSILLEQTLDTFGIEARVTDVTRGPTITRFELEPAPGIKVSRFLALADDLALALKAHRVRVEAPIPGKGRVGIEVPNVQRDQVLLRDLLESEVFKQSKATLPLALGKDIAGDVKVSDLATMPHLLVAGATGAGKTVCVKSLLASMLFTRTPDELQLVLIDPKMVELSVFNDIPHLITPVVTEAKLASTALRWLIHEMEERYRLFAYLRCRNIEVYNESVENGEIEVETEEAVAAESVSVVRKLPYIVCIIDELADLMMLARSEVEDCIARLAQLARAVGIHLVIATQRPSVDVLTGVIKANFPSRVSFQVSSRVDSRCILDEIGAERLIGMGDMLYLPPGHAKPFRIQGAFVSDEEMNDLIAYLKTQAPPQYKDEIENFGRQAEAREELLEENDPLFDDAVRVVLETGQASISMVQRRLRVGYTRAARLIDMMEIRGIVGPHIGSKAREILVDAPPEDGVHEPL
jgi:S-DNA-T family DNA segregation ATPase FtsK/SpoIIIE